MNSSDPLIRDRGLITNRDKETSLKLHRRNSMQRDQLDKELKRLDEEQQRCIRRTHLQKCAISRDQKCLVSDLGKVTFSEGDHAPSDDKAVADQTCSEEPRKSPPPAARRKETVPATKQKVHTSRRVSLPNMLPDHPHTDSSATKKDKQERYIDQKVSREISKLKKASIRADVESKDSDDRKGKPRIPTNAWNHDNENAKARERSSTVFDRLAEATNVNSMSSEQFLQKMRTQRRHTIPAASQTRTKRSERR